MEREEQRLRSSGTDVGRHALEVATIYRAEKDQLPNITFGAAELTDGDACGARRTLDVHGGNLLGLRGSVEGEDLHRSRVRTEDIQVTIATVRTHSLNEASK